MTKRELNNKLGGLLYDQRQLVKYMEESKTREDRCFYKRSIDEMEKVIEKVRKELGLK